MSMANKYLDKHKNDRIIKNFTILCLILSYILKLDLISILLFIIYILNYLKNKEIVIKYAYVLFLIASNIGGVFVIELSKSPFYLYEIAQMSSKESTLAAIILVHVLCLEGIKFIENNYSYKIKNTKFYFHIRYVKFIGLIFIILMSLMLAKVIAKPFFILGYERFAYQKNILSGIEITLGNMLIWVSPIFYLLLREKNKLIGLLGIIIFNIYFFWIGHKFSVFFMGIQLGFIVLLEKIDYDKLNKYIIKLGTIFFMMITIVLYQSSIVHGRSITENIDYLKGRLAQQGQLWWAVYKEDEYREMHLEDAKKETEIFFKINPDSNLKYNLGMFKVMRLVTNDKIVDAKINQGSRYAYSTQANILYYFNYPVLLVFSYILGIGIAYITNLLIRYINQKNIIGILVISKLWITYIRMLSNSDFDTIFSLENIITILILIYFNRIPRKKVNS